MPKAVIHILKQSGFGLKLRKKKAHKLPKSKEILATLTSFVKAQTRATFFVVNKFALLNLIR